MVDEQTIMTKTIIVTVLLIVFVLGEGFGWFYCIYTYNYLKNHDMLRGKEKDRLISWALLLIVYGVIFLMLIIGLIKQQY